MEQLNQSWLLPEAPTNVEEDIPALVSEQLDNVTRELVGGFSHLLFEEDVVLDIEDSNKKRRRKKQATLLTEDQQQLVGKANVLFAKGSFSEAITLLHEVIRKNPGAVEPWLTLANILEETGQQTKAFSAFLMAAHLSRKDGDLWKRLGNLSLDKRQYFMAEYCFNKACKLDPNDIHCQYQLATCYLDMDNLDKAVELLEKILQLDPFNIHVVNELVRIYDELDELDRAISLLESCMDADLHSPLQFDKPQDDSDVDELEIVGTISLGTNLKKTKQRMGFHELFTLCDLHMRRENYVTASNIMTEGIRRLKGDDSYQLEEEFKIPAEIRVQLGICRLKVGDFRGSKDYLEALFELSLDDNKDLYLSVVDAYLEADLNQKAMSLLEYIKNNEKVASTLVLMKLAELTVDQQQAIGLLEKATELAPNEMSIKIQLAKAYDRIGQAEKVGQIQEEIYTNSKSMAIRKDKKEDSEYEESSQSEDEDGSNVEVTSEEELDSMVLMKDKASRSKSLLMAKAEESAKEKENQRIFQELQRGFSSTFKDGIASIDFIHKARMLLGRFQAVKEFYPNERSKKFVGFRSKILQEKYGNTKYQGLSFDEWFLLFIQQTVALSHARKTEDALDCLKLAMDANIYYYDQGKRLRLMIHGLAVSIQGKDYEKIVDYWKMLQSKLCVVDSLQLYNVVFQGGPGLVSVYAASNMQKYFKRQLSLIHHEKERLVLIQLMGHIFLIGRSYKLAIECYQKTYQQQPKDALTNFCLGISLIHHSMQRKVMNRHVTLTEGLSFLLQYYELRGRNAEANFNLGRMFHQIGLFDLSILYYHQVLEFDCVELKPIVCYNLSLLYSQTGSFELAEKLMREHCRV